LEITWRKLTIGWGKGVIARLFSLRVITLEGGGIAVIVGDFCLFFNSPFS